MSLFYTLTGTASPTNGINVGTFSTPAFGDLDGDGDLDLLVGETDGVVNFYRNTGTAAAPSYALQTGTANPFSLVSGGLLSTPTLGDIDGDGDLDLAVGGGGSGLVLYYRNTGTPTAPAYQQITAPANPFSGSGVPNGASPFLVDLDNDRDLDLVVGDSEGRLQYSINTGTRNIPAYGVVTGSNNPFDGIDVGDFSRPSLADVDGDGDLDLIVGESPRVINFFENTGSASSPRFVERIGSASPFVMTLPSVGHNAPSFLDLDGDGDLDGVFGAADGNLRTLISNSAPQLNTLNPNLPETDEDSPSTRIRVSDLLTLAGVSDSDLGAQRGLAITAITGSSLWQYSPNGLTWIRVANVDANQRWLLLDSNTLLRYLPNGQNGETASLSFRAWDRTDGASPSTVGLSNFSGPLVTGGSTAYSSSVSTASLVVNPVNDAPTLSQSAITVTGTDEDTTSAAMTVADLLSAAGLADVDSAAQGGIAVTGFVGNGHWEYSAGSVGDPVSNGSKTPPPTVAPGLEWTPLGTVSDAEALLLSTNALLRYVPDGRNGETASLSFRAWDQTSGSASDDNAQRTGDASINGDSTAFSTTQTTASLAVAPVSDAPTTSALTLAPIHEDTSLPITQALLLGAANDVDLPPQTLVATDLQISTGLGSLTPGPNGAWTYTPAPNDDTQVSFSYTISDGDHTIPGSAKLDLLPVNDAPVAVADAAQTPMGTGVNIAVLANDTDIDGGPLSVSAITQGSSGGVAIRPDGVSVRYTPNAGFAGFDSFTYTANDGAGGTAVGTVRVLVPSYVGTSGNDVPLGTPQADFIASGDGNDRVLAYGGDDYVDGGRGVDTISGGLGNDTLVGGDGADTFLTTAAELAGDSIDGGDAIDTLQITDPIAVMPAVFTLVNVEQLNFPGSLQVGHTALLDLSALTLSGTGNQINGGTAASRITGTRSADRITDSAGNDDLRGGEGNDTIMAGVGQDTVYGGRGNDTLGGSSSTLGDSAIDTFVFNTPLNALTNVDTIIGFEASGLDVMALDSGIFSAIGPTLDATEFRSAIGGLPADANDFILFDPATGALYHDADGSGPVARIQFATLGAGLSGTVDFTDFTIGAFPG